MVWLITVMMIHYHHHHHHHSNPLSSILHVSTSTSSLVAGWCTWWHASNTWCNTMDATACQCRDQDIACPKGSHWVTPTSTSIHCVTLFVLDDYQLPFTFLYPEQHSCYAYFSSKCMMQVISLFFFLADLSTLYAHRPKKRHCIIITRWPEWLSKSTTQSHGFYVVPLMCWAYSHCFFVIIVYMSFR